MRLFRKLSTALLVGIVFGVGSWLMEAQGPLTNALNLRVKTDAAGSLVTSYGAMSGSPGPLTALGNIRLRTDSNGYLMTTAGSGTFTPDAVCLDAANQDVCIRRISAGVINFTNATTGFSRFVLGTNDNSTSTGGSIAIGSAGFSFLTGDGNIPRPVVASVFSPSVTNLTHVGAATGLEFNTSSVSVSSCGTGTVTTGSTSSAGEITATGATACTVSFATAFTNTPFCTIEDETSAVAQRISAISVSAFTVASLTSGDKFMFHCTGRY